MCLSSEATLRGSINVNNSSIISIYADASYLNYLKAQIVSGYKYYETFEAVTLIRNRLSSLN